MVYSYMDTYFGGTTAIHGMHWVHGSPEVGQ